MKQKLSTQLSAGFALIVLVMVALIAIISNLLISRQFEKYVKEQQKDFADGLAEGLTGQYNTLTDEWNLDYIHGFGMYALSDGYIIKVSDTDDNIIWDAENHDMALCHQIMDDIRLRMQALKPESEGDFVTYRYELVQNEVHIGYADISYYSPYYFNENAFQFVDSLNGILFAVGVLSLIGAGFAGVLLAKRILAPIAKTIDITEQIADGNFTVRLDSKVKTEELYELVRSVNHMAEMLDKQDALGKRLTSDIAHELRTPLANVSSQLEAIVEGVWEPTTERLQHCYDELGRLSDLVSDLERLQQIETEKLRLDKESVNLLELSKVVKAAFHMEIEKKHLRCELEGDAAIVYGDKQKLHQVMVNLLSNAVKYSVEGGEIFIRIRDSSDSGTIIVEDHGIGIPDKDLPYIFERFYRTDRSRDRKTGGAGIGLAIAKAIVQAHGGMITVESGEGHGSVFTVTLPKE